MTTGRVVLRTCMALLALAIASVGVAQEQKTAATLNVPGLEEPVEILKDPWGVPHIYAKNEHDLFFAQGYNAVRDRLFQFELWRRQATGTVAEILGRRELKRDIGTRLHIFRGNLRDELSFYHPRGEAIVGAFVDGVNAYIREVRTKPGELPIEFQLLGITPQEWTPAVVISRHNALLANVRQEVSLARAVHLIGGNAVKDVSGFYGDPDLTVDAAVDLSALDDAVLELYTAFREPIRFQPTDIVPAHRASAAAFEQLAGVIGALSPLDPATRPEDIGSNNWVVSGALTQSGLPMVMNDPHRAQQVPSLRYWSHLVAPGWNVIGGGEPVLPGISIGHNEIGAWGLTIFGTDSEDLYVYETNPANPRQYKYRGGWEDMRVIADTIPVKGEAAVAVDLLFTRHGPVLYEDRARRKAYALRAAWMDTGGAPYLASLRMAQATSWDEFRDACSYSRIPAENMVWADRDGNIGWQAVAVAPLRRNWSGLVPVPGDGRYEWDGYLPIKALPHRFNPPEGYIVTANDYLFPRDYAYPAAQHWTAADPFRASRVRELLASGTRFTVADMMRIQNDDLSLPARSLVPLLRGVRPADPTVAKARDALLAWNHVLDQESVPAGIYEMWQRRLTANVREVIVPEKARPFVGQLGMAKIIAVLLAPDGRFGRSPLQARDALVERSLVEAVGELTKKLGPDMSQWYWGQEKYHHALIRHPLSAAVSADVRTQLEVGPVARGGDAYTVSATGGGDNQVSGGSLKLIADLSGWDSSVAINTPGQSGDPRSPDYRGLFDIWARGQYFPILYSRERIDEVVADRTVLQPSAPR